MYVNDSFLFTEWKDGKDWKITELLTYLTMEKNSIFSHMLTISPKLLSN